MRKSTLFISIVLTTFMLAVLFGVVSNYQRIVAPTEVAAASPAPTDQPIVFNDSQAPTEAALQLQNITPEAASALAAKILGRTDLYSVEVTQFEGADVYLVTFSSRDIVYVGLDGSILSISKLPVTVVNQVSTKKSNRNSNEDGNTGGNGSPSGGGGGGGGHGGDDGGSDGGSDD